MPVRPDALPTFCLFTALVAAAALSASPAAAAPARQDGVGGVLHELLPGIFPGAPAAHRRHHSRTRRARRQPPLPVPRPAELGRAGNATSPATQPTPTLPKPPAFPPPRPRAAAAAPSTSSAPEPATAPSFPVPRPSELAQAPSTQRPAAPPPAALRAPALPAYDAACAALARERTVVFRPAAPIERNRCIAPAPVRVSAVRLAGGGTVAVEPATVMRCAMARALARWVRDSVASEAEKRFKTPLTALRIADGYSCRTRDHIPGAKPSEHGRANAIDIGAFRIGRRRWIAVNDAGAAAFLVTVRDRGCTYFNTVLGPGSDRWHTDNLHLDLESRGPHHDGKYCR